MSSAEGGNNREGFRFNKSILKKGFFVSADYKENKESFRKFHKKILMSWF